jgi:putative peptidoglycan binding protein
MISGSVGQDGANDPEDVKAVQRLLGDLQIAEGAIPVDVDGAVGTATIDAILDFQQRQADLPADGTIDPDGSTFIRLDEVCADLYAAIAQVQASSVLAAPAPDGASQDLIDQLEDIRSEFAAITPKGPADGADQFPTPVPQFDV